MLTVGLTGNVASGKTTVADRWRERGVAIVEADRLGHDVLREDQAARDALVEAFGTEIVAPDGSIDRSELGSRAFTTPEAIRRLNAIVHPPLLARLERRLDELEREGHEMAMVDAALIFEFGLDRDLDVLVLVTAPTGIRAERLRRGRGFDDDRIERIMASQMPDADKAASCDFVIVNDGSLDELRAQADLVLDAIRDRTTTRGGRDG
ncbi:MAG: dephospho-CoA kinase [Gemmatimonadota bacterium]